MLTTQQVNQGPDATPQESALEKTGESKITMKTLKLCYYQAYALIVHRT